MDDQERQRWVEDRALAIMGEEVDAELAARPAGVPDADLIKMARENSHGVTRQLIDELKRDGAWDERARMRELAVLRAIIEQGVQDAVDGLGRNPYQLPIPELARRAAELELAVSEGTAPEQLLPMFFDAIFGRGAKLAHWRCPTGHSGYALAGQMLAHDTCPLCDKLLSRWKTIN